MQYRYLLGILIRKTDMSATSYRNVQDDMANGDFKNRLSVRTTLKPMHRTVDLEGTIIDCNDKYAHVLGYDKDEVIGMSIFDHTPTKHRHVIWDIFTNWKKRVPINNRKFPLLTKDGKVFEVLITVEGVVGADDKLVWGRTTLLDYEEVRQFQELVKLSKYESLYEHSPDMYRTVNVDGIIVDCNRAYEVKLGYTKSEIIGRNLTDHTADRSVSDMLINMAQWRTSGKCKPAELWMKKKDNTEFPVLISPTNLFDEDGALLGRNVVIQDLTKMKETKDMLDQRRQIDKMKDEFLTGITHELKTPLTPIIGFSQALVKPGMIGDLNEKQTKAIQTILSNAIHLRHLVTDLLSTHKLELGRMKFDFQEFDIGEMMESITTTMSYTTDEKQIKLVVQMLEEGKVIGDRARIEEIINNLIYNAVDFTPSDTGQITVTVKRDGKFLWFSVADNGVGIPKAKQAKLFHKFYQADLATTRRHGGTGLGLSICKGLVEGMGGKIGVKSAEGRGSTFYFTILPGSHDQK